jgi:hypothetical protein
LRDGQATGFVLPRGSFGALENDVRVRTKIRRLYTLSTPFDRGCPQSADRPYFRHRPIRVQFSH